MKKLIFLLLFGISISYAQNKDWTFFSQRVNIEKHNNKKFIFSADVKANTFSFNGCAALFVNILGDDDYFFDNMYDRPIVDNTWKNYTIQGVIDNGAELMNLGGMVKHQGEFYFDNISLKVLESNGTWTEIPILNTGFENKIIENDVPEWKDDQKNKNFSYSSSSLTPNNNNNYSLLIKSAFHADEIPVDATSIKMNSNEESILIENITVINVKTGKQRIRSVLIRDQKITKIAKEIKVTNPKTITIDGTGKWLLPGLIDSHVHLFQSGSLYTRPDAFDLTKYRPYEDERKWLRQHVSDLLKRYLQSGITTIIDVGGPFYNYKIRDLYSDHTSFPNIYLTGPLISTYQPKAFNIEDSPIIKVNTPVEAIDLVKQQLPYKPNFIKIWYINDGDADSNYEIVKATIEESHKHNLKVAVHATELETAKRAIKAKADILVHSVREPIDNEFIKMITSNNVNYIPTLMVSDKYTEAFTQEIEFTNIELELSNPFPIKSFSDYKHLDNENLFKRYKKSRNAFRRYQIDENRIEAENLKLLQEKNVNIATGTDAGNIGTLHATSYQEEVELMLKAGLSNLEIIQASTINAAKLLDKDSEIGSIEVSKLADLIILENNPLEDIKALQKISHVIKAGSAFKAADVLIESPENIVQKQVNAYNLRNVEAFLENFSNDIEIYNFPDQLVTKGKENYKVGFIEFFKKYPDLHCEIVKRTVIGNTVVDHERVKYADGDYNEVVAIYKIENEKIAKVYFIRN